MSIKQISTYEALVKGKPQGKKKILLDFKKTYPAYIVLVVMIAASFAVMEFIDNSVKADQKLAFEKAANSLVTRMEKHNEDIMHVHNNMVNLFENTFVVRDVFELNGSNAVNTYESLLSINYVYQVYDEELPEFIHFVRSQGYYDLKIHPKADRDVYYIVEYVVPFEGNEERSGFDYASDSIALEHIKRADEIDTVLVTPVYEFRPGVTGFQIIKPVYKLGDMRETLEHRVEKNLGTLIMEIDSEKFFEEALGDGIAADSTLFFSIIDKEAENEDIIYKSENYKDTETAGFTPVIEDVRTFNIAEKEYDIKLTTIPGFGGEFQQYLPYLSLLISLLISFILFAFIISVITARERAEEIADRVTRAQRRIVDTSKDIIGILDLQGSWKTVNEAVRGIFKLDPDDVVGQKIKDLYKDNSDEKEFSKSVIKTKEEASLNQTVLMSANGNERWIDWNFSISKNDGLIYAIGRDVSLEKIAERENYIRSKQMNLAEHFAKEANVSKSFLIRDISDKLLTRINDSLGGVKELTDADLNLDENYLKTLSEFEENSNHLHNIVDSMKEGTILTDKSHGFEIEKINFIEELNNILEKFKYSRAKTDLTINLENYDLKELYIYANKESLYETYKTLLGIMAPKGVKTEMEIQVQKNKYEQVIEMEIMTSPNKEFSEQISKYKEFRNNIIEAMRFDDNDYLYNIALVESDFKRMNGNMTIESLGEDAENLVIITIPLNI